ncbi:MAG: serine protease [Flavobacteriales bacterium]|nr:serine protease [Flavobacteriales bacterium]
MRKVGLLFLLLASGILHAQKSTIYPGTDSLMRPEGAKYISVDNAVMDLEQGAIVKNLYDSQRSYDSRNPGAQYYNERDIIEFDRSLRNKVMSQLFEWDYLDTTGSIMPDVNNSLKLDVIVQEIALNIVVRKKSSMVTFTTLEIQIDFELKSHYGVSLIKKEERKSAVISLYDEEDENYMESLLETMLRDFIGSEEVQSKIKQSGSYDYVDVSGYTPLNCKGGNAVSNVSSWLPAVTTVIGEHSHGSACSISSDGYLLTNMHVVEQAKTVRVKWMDGTSDIAEVVRKHPECDLALLKVDRTGLPALPVKIRDVVPGEKIYVIGTPADTLLSQSVSKGIVSGQRDIENVSLIQIDARVNGGNSGGALMDENGYLIGIVSAKYKGFGIEGIGFAVPARKANELLKIDFAAPQPTPVVTPSKGKAKKK